MKGKGGWGGLGLEGYLGIFLVIIFFVEVNHNHLSGGYSHLDSIIESLSN